MANVREVADSLAVGQKRGSDERVVLFVKMADGQTFTQELEAEIRKLIRTLLSPRHVPEIILPIEDIPVRHAALGAGLLVQHAADAVAPGPGPVWARWVGVGAVHHQREEGRGRGEEDYLGRARRRVWDAGQPGRARPVPEPAPAQPVTMASVADGAP